MKYSILEKTDIKISKIGLGTNAVGGHNLFQNLNEEDGKGLVRAAIDNGVTLIDTADVYGKGRSEELVGEVLREHKRQDVVLATKGGMRWQADGSMTMDNDPAYLRSAVAASLKRLQTTHVDLYYIHFPAPNASLKAAVAELVKLKKEAKIRAIGVSNVSLEQLMEANSMNDVSALEISYSMLERSVEKDILPYCKENNISVVAYGPLAFGLLGGSFTRDTKINDWRNSVPLFHPGNYERVLEKVEQLKDFARRKSMSLPNMALAWLLAQPAVDSVIPGGRKPARIIDNLKALDIVLGKDDLKQIDSILI
jgi:myo-inositol catabolism protein IolS